MPEKSVLILANLEKPGVGERVERLRPWIAERADVIGVAPTGGPLPDGADEAAVCLVFGGDGSLLAAARILAGTGLPILGVNMGKLGFLAEFTVEHMQKHFEDVLAGGIQVTDRMMLDVCIQRDGEKVFSSPAANDGAVLAGHPFRMIDLLVALGNREITRYLGDGLIAATPTGSTGYTLSAGGPILEPTLDALVITPIAAHSLSMRPIVVRCDRTVRIVAERVNEGSTLVIDGQVPAKIHPGDEVFIRRADAPMRVIPHPGRPFFHTLSAKLDWGQSPHHRSGA